MRSVETFRFAALFQPFPCILLEALKHHITGDAHFCRARTQRTIRRLLQQTLINKASYAVQRICAQILVEVAHGLYISERATPSKHCQAPEQASLVFTQEAIAPFDSCSQS